MSRRLSKSVMMAVASFLVVSAALAANNRSAVSLNGMDTNPCTTVSPCRSFSAALGVTASGGEVIALDSAGYGPFTINHAVTVSGAPGVHAAITVSSGTGIEVNAGSTDVVTLRNLILIGAGGAAGIIENYALELRVIGCVIRSFSQIGIRLAIGSFTMDRSAVTDLPGGVGIEGAPLVATLQATISNSSIEGNDIGLEAGPRSKFVLTKCKISGNGDGARAISIAGTGAPEADLTVERSTVAHNGSGLVAWAYGANNVASLFVSDNIFAYNASGIVVADNGSAFTFQDNRFLGNIIDVEGTPMSSIAFQ